MKRSPITVLALIILLGLALRVYHLHNPILDHPAWRQGDESAIARNFFELRNDIFYPQTDYDGPPPNYVELELQLVPYGAAQLYRFFGVHEIFARLLVIAFSLGTIPLVYALGSALYSRRAGLIAALLFAIVPGAVYYGRAIIPESDMLFFSVGALLFWWRFLGSRRLVDFCLAAGFAALAFLAKPPALVILAPMLASWFVRAREKNGPQGAALRPLATDWAPYALLVIGLVPLCLYFGHLHRIAEWHWATGITSRHVIPALVAAFTHPGQALAGVRGTLALARMLATTILGPVIFGCLMLCAFVQPQDGALGRSAFFGAWLTALILYAFAVVNVERVDYYLMPFVPFAVLYVGGGLDHLLALVAPQGIGTRTAAALAVACFFTVYSGMSRDPPILQLEPRRLLSER